MSAPMFRKGITLPSMVFRMLKPGGKQLAANEVAFKVPLDCNKIQIQNYLEEIYKVNVTKVNTMVYLGKTKRNLRNGREYKRPDWKKAIVTLEEEFEWPDLEEIYAKKPDLDPNAAK